MSRVHKAHFTLGYGSHFFRQAAGTAAGPCDRLLFVTPLAASRWTCPPVQYQLDKTLGKIGLVEFGPTMRHLIDWRSFYIPGRLHKPFKVLEVEDEMALQTFTERVKWNRVKALQVAFYLKPNETHIREVLSRLVGLSYLGDLRMRWAENPRKIENIVDGQFEHLLDIYRPLFAETAGLRLNEITGRVVCRQSENRWGEFDTRELAKLNRRESGIMAIKGLFSNDLATSLRYVVRKIGKRSSGVER